MTTSSFLLALLTSTMCCAQISETYQSCSKLARKQYEMNVCANEEAKRVNDELNKIYELLLLKVRANPITASKIQIAQKAWETYRDSYIDAMYPAKDKQSEYGTLFPVEVDLLSAELNRQQIRALQRILRQNGKP
jgi:uncharacterized protein YecT (DUF1311 family)